MKSVLAISLFSVLLLAGCGKDVTSDGFFTSASQSNVTASPGTPAPAARCESSTTKMDIYTNCCTRPAIDKDEFKCCVDALVTDRSKLSSSKRDFWEYYEKVCYKLKEALNKPSKSSI